MSGYVRLYRDVWKHPIFRNAAEAAAFSKMICDAAYKESRVKFRGVVVTLQRGQLATSTREIAKTWGWSEASARRFLGRLEADKMIIRGGRKTDAGGDAPPGTPHDAPADAHRDAPFTVLTICNYDVYQPSLVNRDAPDDARLTHQVTHERRTPDAQNNKENEGKEESSSESKDSSLNRDDEKGNPELPLKARPGRGRKKKNGAGGKTLVEQARPLVDVWNETMAGTKIPKVEKITNRRARRLMEAVAGMLDGSPERWRSLCAQVAASDHLNGAANHNGYTWRCSFDWLIEEDNLIKVVEGNYGDGNDGGQSEAREWLDRFHEWMEGGRVGPMPPKPEAVP